MMAEQRAVAAEIIAQEANAVRLQALLDAARAEAADRDIRTAEERFSAAKVRWERVRQGLQPEPEPDPYAEADGSVAPPPVAPSPASVAAWRAALDAGLARPKDVLLAGMPMLVLAGVVATAVHYHFQSRPMTAIEPAAMPTPPVLGLEKPAEAPAAGVAAPLSAPAALPNGMGGTVDALPKAEAPAADAAPRLKPAPVVRKKPTPPAARQPRQEPEPETLAVSTPIPVEPERPLPRAE